MSVHGANRLGGNSLLETIVFGRRAGIAASEYVRSTDLKIFPDTTLVDAAHEVALILNRREGERASELRKELSATMNRYVGVFRERSGLKKAYEKVCELKERFNRVAIDDRGDIFNTDLQAVFELRSILDLAEAIVLGALNREESRGAHYRKDHPKRNDRKWLKHTIFSLKDGELTIDYKDVTITKFQPTERKY